MKCFGWFYILKTYRFKNWRVPKLQPWAFWEIQDGRHNSNIWASEADNMLILVSTYRFLGSDNANLYSFKALKQSFTNRKSHEVSARKIINQLRLIRVNLACVPSIQQICIVYFVPVWKICVFIGFHNINVTHYKTSK